MEAFRDLVRDSRWLGTEAHWIMDRFALEIGRYTKYKDTTNYDDAVPAIKSVIETYEGSPEGRSIWLRMLSEVDYNDYDNCQRYDLCKWYEGDGFQANFRKVLFPDVIECPETACEGNSIRIFAQDLACSHAPRGLRRIRDSHGGSNSQVRRRVAGMAAIRPLRSLPAVLLTVIDVADLVVILPSFGIWSHALPAGRWWSLR